MEGFSSFNNLEINYSRYLIKEASKKRYVLDASVIAKWYYKKDEEDLRNASVIYGSLQSKNSIFFAPDLLIYELLNIYRAKLEMGSDKIDKIVSEIYDLIVILGVNKNTFLKAFVAARSLNISYYDSIYLSISEDLGAMLITADKKLYGSVKDTYQDIVLLSDFIK